MVKLKNALVAGSVMVFAGCSLAVNIACLIVFAKGGFLKKSKSSVYLLSFVNVIDDCLQMALTLCYGMPSSIAQVKMHQSVSDRVPLG